MQLHPDPSWFIQLPWKTRSSMTGRPKMAAVPCTNQHRGRPLEWHNRPAEWDAHHVRRLGRKSGPVVLCADHLQPFFDAGVSVA